MLRSFTIFMKSAWYLNFPLILCFWYFLFFSQDAGIWYIFHNSSTGDSHGLIPETKAELTPLGIFFNNRVHSNFKVIKCLMTLTPNSLVTNLQIIKMPQNTYTFWFYKHISLSFLYTIFRWYQTVSMLLLFLHLHLMPTSLWWN